MSDGTKRPHAQVMHIAEGLRTRLYPVCEQIEIVGSLRRQCPMVGDIELIAIPMYYKVVTDLFGATKLASMLNTMLDGLLDKGLIRHTEPKRWGDKLRAFTLTTSAGETYKVDLFIQPDKATWAVNKMIRTGSWEFSKFMVTPKSQGGAMPDDLRVRDARVWRNGVALDTPTEKSVFALWGMDFVSPEKRTGELVR